MLGFEWRLTVFWAARNAARRDGWAAEALKSGAACPWLGATPGKYRRVPPPVVGQQVEAWGGATLTKADGKAIRYQMSGFVT